MRGSVLHVAKGGSSRSRLIETTMHRSVVSRAGEIALPKEPSRELVAEGAGHYAESCVYCHGAPGQDPAKWSLGIRPEPPHLTEHRSEERRVGNEGVRTGRSRWAPYH